MASGVDARLLKSTKFPAEFNQKVDMQKVNLQVMKKWIASRISEILQNEDDVVIELCFNLIEGPRYPNIKALQIQLTGFLDKDTAPFCKELWKLLLSAQTSPQGVPKELLEAKKLELIQEKMEADKAAQDSRKRREDTDRREREIAELKERDRRDIRARGDTRQARGGGRPFEDRGRGGQHRNRSRSREARTRELRDPYGRDRYVPANRHGEGRERARPRDRSRSASESASSRSRSRSRSSSRSSTHSIRRPLRRGSSPQRREVRKRSRSPRGDAYRPGRRDRAGKEHHDAPPRRSRSGPSDHRSPANKRRRYSSSRSRSVERRRRHASSSSSRSRTSSTSRSRSRGRDSSPEHSRRASRGGRPKRARRNSTSDHSDNERRQVPVGLGRRDNRGRQKVETRDRRRNSSSISTSSRRRSRSADDSKVANPPTRPAQTKSPLESNGQESTLPNQQAGLLKEKLLREKIIKMRSSGREVPVDEQG